MPLDLRSIELFRDANLADVLDVAFISLLIYAVLVWFKKTKAFFVLLGIIIISGLYLVAKEFRLLLTASILEKFFAVILIAIIVIFQEEFRHFFEQIAFWSFHRGRKKGTKPLTHPTIEVIARTLTDFARERVGALLVLQGREMIVRHLENGEDLNGELSEALLKSLFDPHSMGHDGAVVLEEGRITKFGCYLPLSKDITKHHVGGTRHAAALGLSELTDALCLVVSEERGTISAARHGAIKVVPDAKHLVEILEKFHRETASMYEKGLWANFIQRNTKEKFIAVIFALILWFVLVQGSKPVYKTFTVPVRYLSATQDLVVANLEPSQIEVTFSGPTSAFYFVDSNDIHVVLKTFNLVKGKRFLNIAPSDVAFPKNIILERIVPSRVQVNAEEKLKDAETALNRKPKESAS